MSASLPHPASPASGDDEGALPPLCPKNTGRQSAGRPKASEAEARMHDLIQTAGQLFLEKGYDKVSLEMIAREARVAVRTIYVKFGGKAGLLTAVINASRSHFFATMTDLEHDQRPLRDVLADFGRHFIGLVMSTPALRLYRMVIADAQRNRELADAFFEAGPRQTREMLERYFSRPDIRVQLRADVPTSVLPVHLMNCILGDQLRRYLYEVPPEELEGAALCRQLQLGLDLFLRGTLRE